MKKWVSSAAILLSALMLKSQHKKRMQKGNSRTACPFTHLDPGFLCFVDIARDRKASWTTPQSETTKLYKE